MRQNQIRLPRKSDLAEPVAIVRRERGHGKACAAAVGEGSARVPLVRKTSISPPPVAAANA